MIKYNLNYEATIEIKENTLDIIRNKIFGDKDEYMKACILPRIKEVNGIKFLTLQLWEIFEFFGDSIHIGCNPPFGTDIYLEEEHCVKVEDII